ncbi:hypothetical protein GJAV_G00058820 [Gymnothorax javanicus]|nr:hypothetical protein GJAV_G00058820 [Gymnothorax javanicus]
MGANGSAYEEEGEAPTVMKGVRLTKNVLNRMKGASSTGSSQSPSTFSTQTASSPQPQASTQITSSQMPQPSTQTTSLPQPQLSAKTTSPPLPQPSTQTTSPPLPQPSTQTTSLPQPQLSNKTTSPPLPQPSTPTTPPPLPQPSTPTTSDPLPHPSTQTTSPPLTLSAPGEPLPPSMELASPSPPPSPLEYTPPTSPPVSVEADPPLPASPVDLASPPLCLDASQKESYETISQGQELQRGPEHTNLTQHEATQGVALDNGQTQAGEISAERNLDQSELKDLSSAQDRQLWAHLHAHQLEQRMIQLKKQDVLYREQVAKLELKGKRFYNTITENYQKASQEFSAKFRHYQRNPVCAELQSEILKCYRENMGQTLSCSGIASLYLQCVREARQSKTRPGD